MFENGAVAGRIEVAVALSFRVRRIDSYREGAVAGHVFKPVLHREIGIAGADFPPQLTGIVNSIHSAQFKTAIVLTPNNAAKIRPITQLCPNNHITSEDQNPWQAAIPAGEPERSPGLRAGLA